MIYDLIICGAGAIGLYLADKFSQKGYSAMVLEKKKEIGLPLKCSGHVSSLFWNFIPFNEKLIQNEIFGARFHTKNRIHEFSSNNVVSYVLDRVKLDQYLALQAEKSGATILKEHSILNFEDKSNFVKIKVNNRNEIKNFKSKLLAGCDGPNSKVRRISELSEPKELLKGIFCYADEKDKSHFIDVYLNGSSIIAWRIPRGKKVEYGVLTHSKDNEPFKEFQKEMHIDSNEIYSGLIPIGGVKPSYKGRTFLVGDSAAQVKPFTGGGLVYGLKCANIASRIIDPNKPETLRIYDKTWRADLSLEIVLGFMLRKFYYFPPMIQDFLFKIVRGNIQAKIDMPSTFYKQIFKF